MSLTKPQEIALNIFINYWPEEWTFKQIIEGIQNESNEIEIRDYYEGFDSKFLQNEIEHVAFQISKVVKV